MSSPELAAKRSRPGREAPPAAPRRGAVAFSSVLALPARNPLERARRRWWLGGTGSAPSDEHVVATRLHLAEPLALFLGEKRLDVGVRRIHERLETWVHRLEQRV